MFFVTHSRKMAETPLKPTRPDTSYVSLDMFSPTGKISNPTTGTPNEPDFFGKLTSLFTPNPESNSNSKSKSNSKPPDQEGGRRKRHRKTKVTRRRHRKHSHKRK